MKSDGFVEGGTGNRRENRVPEKMDEKPKQKVLMITNHSYMFWQFRRELVAELMKEYEVVISMPFVGHEDDFRNEGVRCIQINVDRRGINPITDLSLARKYYCLLKKEKPDKVITYSIKPNIYAGYACRVLKIPYYVNVQGLGTAFQKKPISSIVTVMYKTALKDAGKVFFENEMNADKFMRLGITKKSMTSVMNGAGVNLDYYKYQVYPGEEDGIHFLFLGRIMKEKGVDELFDAAKHLKKKYGKQIVFDLVGFFEDEYRETVEKLVDHGVIRFHGFQSDPIPYYGSSHCVVLPSYHEGMSNVLLEGAAAGRALITSDIPGCREAVDDGTNGYLCKKMDSRSLEDCMNRFMLLDFERRRDMGIAGRRKMEAEFDKNDVVRKTVEALN